jgi:hypothetical protein
MVVANAGYDDNTTNIETFSDVMYHGAVVWSWQQALMAAGITKQLNRCGPNITPQADYSDNYTTTTMGNSTTSVVPSWCNTSLVADLQAGQTLLWEAIAGSSSALYTEVWSPLFSNSTNTFSIGDLGAISPSGTEGDAVQLWSYGFLSAVTPSGKAVAGGNFM